jgi:hypothetical protein
VCVCICDLKVFRVHLHFSLSLNFHKVSLSWCWYWYSPYFSEERQKQKGKFVLKILYYNTTLKILLSWWINIPSLFILSQICCPFCDVYSLFSLFCFDDVIPHLNISASLFHYLSHHIYFNSISFFSVFIASSLSNAHISFIMNLMIWRELGE